MISTVDKQQTIDNKQDLQLRIQRIENIYEEFLQQLEVLRDRKDEIVKKVLQRSDQEKIEQLLDDIKNLHS